MRIESELGNTLTEQTEERTEECLWSDSGVLAPGSSQSQGGRNPPPPPPPPPASPPSSPAQCQSLQSTLLGSPFWIPSPIISQQISRECSKYKLVSVRAAISATKLRQSAHLDEAASSTPPLLFSSAVPRRRSRPLPEQKVEDHQSYSKTLPLLGKSFS